MDERMQWLQCAAAEGDVDALFLILEEDPLVLERFDEKAFLSTPLHRAVREGKIQFAKEIVNLKPSFVNRRDHLGRSPLHLALERKHQEERNASQLALEENYQEVEGRGPLDLDLEEKYQELVTWLIQIDSELVHVKAKGLVTPLHYAAEIDDETNLADFLYVCPSSIEDLTVECETAVHVALKNSSFRSFKKLLGWLRRFDKERILYWEDKDGNNALHTAISENKPEAVKMLINNMKVNQKNGKGLTALDIFYDRENSLNPEVREILRGAKAKRASQLHRQRKPSKSPRFSLLKFVFDNVLGDLSFMESILKRLWLGGQSIKNVPLEVRNVVLVVAVLIATATYQAAISPPGGYWQDDGNLQLADNSTAIRNTTTTVFGTGTSKERVGHMILGSSGQLFFLICNSLAFLTSVCLLLIFMIGLPFSGIIITSTSLMVASFSMAVVETSYYHKDSVVGYLFFIFLFVSGTAAYYIPTFMYVQGKMLTIKGRKKKLRLGHLQVQTT